MLSVDNRGGHDGDFSAIWRSMRIRFIVDLARADRLRIVRHRDHPLYAVAHVQDLLVFCHSICTTNSALSSSIGWNALVQPPPAPSPRAGPGVSGWASPLHPGPAHSSPLRCCCDRPSSQLPALPGIIVFFFPFALAFIKLPFSGITTMFIITNQVFTYTTRPCIDAWQRARRSARAPTARTPTSTYWTVSTTISVCVSGCDYGPARACTAHLQLGPDVLAVDARRRVTRGARGRVEHERRARAPVTPARARRSRPGARARRIWSALASSVAAALTWLAAASRSETGANPALVTCMFAAATRCPKPVGQAIRVPVHERREPRREDVHPGSVRASASTH
jgi:hypothetical protein